MPPSQADAHSNKDRHRNSTSRVILLLDLDCFYAQCVCVRLGWAAAGEALALLQWNSVLAVTYPARELYGIQRGDSWEAVRRKSRGHCRAVHVPVLTTTTTTTTTAEESKQQPEEENSNAAAAAGGGVTTSEALSAPVSLQEEYDRLYNLTPEQQEEARRSELGVRRYSTEGKACIECFRIASAKIFDTVHQYLQQQHSSTTVVLERASIDEFFLDATAAVDNDDYSDLNMEEFEKAVKETVVIGENENGPQTGDAAVAAVDDDEDRIRLQRGCWIAHQIRKAVYETLGFTMSAGISINKTIAKLAASHGKPAGHAVCFPSAVPHLLQTTDIRKCRNLGGKLGSTVQALLPPGAPTVVGSIARYLSLPALRSALKDAATADWVYNIAQGVDPEPVQAKTQSSAILTKSITAFKSLNFAPTSSNDDTKNSNSGKIIGHSLPEASRWIQLLAQEVVTRVERDASRNHRYPRNCTIQYALTRASHGNSKSVRVAFPAQRLSASEKVEQLVRAVPKAIESKEDTKRADFRLHRVGLCATDFARSAAGQSIDSFFQVASTAAAAKDVPSSTTSGKAPASATDETKALPPTSQKRPHARASISSNGEADDLKLAQRLQETYDRENRGWHVLEQSKKRKSKQQQKSHRIDGFFQKKK